MGHCSVGCQQDEIPPASSVPALFCPDGWHKYGRAGCNCFWLAEYEMVTRDDASVLCSFHQASVAELDGPAINYWLKGELLSITDVGQFTQFWLGAYTNERHSEHHPGEWFWPTANKTVEWFDWAEGQPNNLQGQDCLAMTEFHNPSIPVFRDFFWNDVSCDTPHHYICQKQCA